MRRYRLSGGPPLARMLQADLDALAAALQARKAELEAVAATSREAARPVELDQARIGRLSRMDALQAQAMARAAAGRREQQLARIEGALRRIEAGEYGDCFVCGEPIGVARLRADPTLTRCLRCAET